MQLEKQNVLNCSFREWYPKFESLTIKSKVIKVSSEFKDYLLSDGVVMPKSCLEDEVRHVHGSESSEDEPDQWSHDYDDDDSEEMTAPEFPELQDNIVNAIDHLGGSVFIKLNWSAPRDACWISETGTLKCLTPKDVYMLLKSSDFISHDLSEPFMGCSDELDSNRSEINYDLILRQWISIQTSSEFRCFVKDNVIVGICPRDYTNFYPNISQHKSTIVSDIRSFHNDKIRERFPDNSYVMDVYHRGDGDVVLVDFNPFGPITDSLLFDWGQLTDDTVPDFNQSTTEDGVAQYDVLRYISDNQGIQPSPYLTYSMPVDFVHLSLGTDPNKLIDFLKMETQQQDEADSD